MARFDLRVAVHHLGAEELRAPDGRARSEGRLRLKAARRRQRSAAPTDRAATKSLKSTFRHGTAPTGIGGVELMTKGRGLKSRPRYDKRGAL